MPQSTRARMLVCRDCDGFAAAAITTGTRNPDGSRTTTLVTCPACDGHGTTTARTAAHATAGR